MNFESCFFRTFKFFFSQYSKIYTGAVSITHFLRLYMRKSTYGKYYIYSPVVTYESGTVSFHKISNCRIYYLRCKRSYGT